MYYIHDTYIISITYKAIKLPIKIKKLSNNIKIRYKIKFLK